MIELTPTTALMTYLGLTLLCLLVIWIIQLYFSRHKKVYIPEKSLFVCEYCHFAYLKEEGKKISQCPQCRSYNSLK